MLSKYGIIEKLFFLIIINNDRKYKNIQKFGYVIDVSYIVNKPLLDVITTEIMPENFFLVNSTVIKYVRSSNPILVKNGITLYDPKISNDMFPIIYVMLGFSSCSKKLFCENKLSTTTTSFYKFSSVLLAPLLKIKLHFRICKKELRCSSY